MRTAVEEYGMLDNCGGVIAAFSGGADSRAMVHALTELCREDGVPIMCAHVNHMLRGAEADGDEAFCRRICAEADIPLEVLRTDVAAAARKAGKGFEETARNIRYEFFYSLMEKYPGFDRIATAHTASDNGETVLFNLARGGGINGLCGIPPVRGNIIRPLIDVTRGEVLDYCRENSLEYVTDSTNKDTKYSRNYIRAEIMPRLDGLYGDVASSIGRSSRNLRRDRDYLDTEAGRIFCELYENGLPSHKLRELHPAMLSRVLMLAYGKISEKKAESVHLEAVERCLKRGEEPFEVWLPGDVVCRCERGLLCFRTAEETVPIEMLPLKEGENILSNGARLVLLSAEHIKNTQTLQNVYNLSIFARVKGDTIKKGLYARAREPGDSYRFGNMQRRLKKLFNDKKLPKKQRDSLPVICDGEGILWVPHFRVRDGAAGKDSETDYLIYYIEAPTGVRTEDVK